MAHATLDHDPKLASTERFSDRVDAYARYRPSYPPELLDFLYETGVPRGAAFADIGAGTGISTKFLLDAGHRVVAVEPNAAMRAACDAWLGGEPRYSSVSGTAEATTLPDASVDAVAIAQAFHWFDAVATKRELLRILKPAGFCAVLSNNLRRDGSAFLRGYEELLRTFSEDYREVAKLYPEGRTMNAWYGGNVNQASFGLEQRFDFEGLRGRLASSSFAPKEGHPSYAPMLARLRELFDAEVGADGRVAMEYDTVVYVGRPLPT
jgi:SAM-dependent methyltransferase